MKEALKKLILKALETTIKDIIMFRDMKEDKLSSAQMRTIIMERIAGDVMNQVIRMDVDHVEGRVDESVPDGLPPVPPRHQEEWANLLGYTNASDAVDTRA